MRFFFLSSLVVLGILNVCMPVQVEIYASHCELDKSRLQVQEFQVRSTGLPEAGEKEARVTSAQKEFARKGLEAVAIPWLQKLKLIR